jgi:hypothetical protein
MKAAAVFAIAVSVFTMSARAVHAQITHDSTVGAIRLGAFVPVNSNTIQQYGRYDFVGGLDYTFQNDGINQRDIVSVDYLQQSHTDSQTNTRNSIRIIPVTVGRQNIGGARGQGVRPFTEFGAGVYFVHFKNPSDTNFGGSDTEESTAFGGYLGAGLELSDSLFIDGRFHVTTPVKDVNTDALELTAGVRF